MHCYTKRWRTMTDFSFEKYLNTENGRELSKSYPLSEYGIWRIFGECQNPDFGGVPYLPELDLVECTLEVAIHYAVAFPEFWTWGAGGRIQRLAEPKKLTMEEVRHRAELNARLKQLEIEKSDILRQIKGRI